MILSLPRPAAATDVAAVLFPLPLCRLAVFFLCSFVIVCVVAHNSNNNSSYG